LGYNLENAVFLLRHDTETTQEEQTEEENPPNFIWSQLPLSSVPELDSSLFSFSSFHFSFILKKAGIVLGCAFFSESQHSDGNQ